jgi:hypothetical protein
MNYRTHVNYFNDTPIGVELGYQYMQGLVGVADIQQYLYEGNGTGWSDKVKEVRQGTLNAIEEGIAIDSRVQPEQDPETLAACSGYACYLTNGEVLLSRRVKKFTKSSFQTVYGECLKIKDGWEVLEGVAS